MSVPISLYLLKLHELRAISSDQGVEDFELETGALPPVFITSTAIKDIEAGKKTLWHSYFLFLRGVIAVGSGGFRGAPKDGRVEIGYGVAESQRRKGVATEAANLLVNLAFEQPGVNEVFAETSVANTPSRRVVEKAGFQHIGQRDTEDDGLVDQWLITRA
jgi:[ribosomal protein S5]-alanine N-acetyltransferase